MTEDDEVRELFRVTISSIGDAVITTDAQGRVATMNPVAESLTGWTQSEAAGRPLAEVFRIVNEDTRENVDNPVEKVLLSGRASGLANHTILIRKNGTDCPIDDSAAPIRNASNVIVGVVLVFRDITERRQTERAVADALAYAESIVDTVREPLVILDADLRVKTASRSFYETFHVNPVETQGQFIYDLGNRQWDIPSLRKLLEEILPQKSLFNDYEVEHTFPTIGKRVMRLNARRLHREGDSILILLAVEDITDMRNSEARVASELKRMTSLHELVYRLHSATNLQEALEEVLKATIALLGADMGNVQLLNQQTNSLEIVAKRGYQPEFLDHFRTVRSDDGASCGRAMKSGKRVVIEDVQTDVGCKPHVFIFNLSGIRAVQSTPLTGRSGELLGMLSSHFRQPHQPAEDTLRVLDLYAQQAGDFIERIRSRDALRQLASELSDADRRKSEFLAMLAHELRNPLAPIRNGLQILRLKGDGDAEEKSTFGMMERQMGQMTRLIDDLLDVSRISRGKIELKRGRIDLASTINHAIEAARPLYDRMDQSLTVALPPTPIYLNADPTRLAQVIGNLLTNASKFTERDGRISLSVECEGNDAVMRVKDNGIGIAVEQLPRIFEMFTQIDTSLERSQGGLGIGLTLVKSLVELHGGTVHAHSEGIGRGTEFVVRLPVLTEPAEVPQQTTTEGTELTVSRRILVVDDNRDSADSLAIVLRMLGHEVQTAHDGLQAVEADAAFLPDVILLDIGLPKLNGYEAARRIREQQGDRKLLMVALTGWGQETDRIASEKAGFDAHMVKPADLDALGRLLAGSVAK